MKAFINLQIHPNPGIACNIRVVRLYLPTKTSNKYNHLTQWNKEQKKTPGNSKRHH